MAEVAARPWLVAGWSHVGLAVLLGVALAAGAGLFSPFLHLLVLVAGLALVAGGLAYGFAPPFLKREVAGAWPAQAALVLVLLGDALGLLGAVGLPGLPGVAGLRGASVAYGAALVALPLHLAATAFFGKPWRGGVALFAKDQPYRRGDLLAAACFAVALVALAAGGALLAALPRGIPSAPLALLMLGFALPFQAGVLVFLLPRNAKKPLPGALLVGAALGVQALAALALAVAFAFPAGADFRFPSAAVLLAVLLFLVAMRRLGAPEKPGPQLARALPFLRGAAALAVLAGLALPLAMAGGAPSSLLPVAAYATILLAVVLAAASTLLAAPILLNAVPREGRWGAWSAALAIAGGFLLAPAFQHARSPFPGALVLALSAALLLWGLWPMRRPRRECPP